MIQRAFDGTRWMAAAVVLAACTTTAWSADGEKPLKIKVTTTAAEGGGSLAAAIDRANAAGGPAVITLDPPASDAGYDKARGVWTIRLGKPLANLAGGGITIAGPARKPAADGRAPAPAVEIVAAKPGIEYAVGMISPGCRLVGVGIGGFKYAVVLYGPMATGCEVRACRLGLPGRGNETGVILVEGAAGNTLEDNVISGNANLGVYLGGRQTRGNAIRGNRIGTDAAGRTARGNRVGVMAAGSAENAVGPGNVISGNADIGVLLVGKGTEGNAIRGNLIGVAADGKAPLGNNIGVVLKALANGNRIGGTDERDRNIISANTEIGVYIEAADDNVLVGNYLGPDATGLAPAGDGEAAQGNGVEFNTVAAGNVLGGTEPGQRNLISGNRVYGVVYYGRCTRNTTAGNYIGVDATGRRALPNATGICVDCASHHNDITGNVISGNLNYGMFFVTRGTEHNRLRGNRIGTDAEGRLAVPNDIGMVISTGACDNVVGGDGQDDGNVISGNRRSGIMITNQHTERNVVAGNVIGLDAAGRRPLGNAHGVLLATHPRHNVVRGNTISGNRSAGVILWEAAAENEVVGNRIGAAASGGDAAAVPNGAGGVVIGSRAAGNVVGREGAENVIVGHDDGGVLVGDDAGPGNRVGANRFAGNAAGAIVGDPAAGSAATQPAPRTRPAQEPLPPAPPATRQPLKPLAVGGDRRVFTVTTTRDGGPGSLRWALQRCNAAGGSAAVHFRIPTDDPGHDADTATWRIRLTDTPPSLVVGDVILDGATQPRAGSGGDANAPAVILDGGRQAVEYGVSVLAAPRIVVRGLSVVGFIYGIQVYGEGAEACRIEGCWLGIEPGGEANGNYNGVELISGAAGNVVGGSRAALRNVVAGNVHVGIRLSDANDNAVIGNFVGLDPTGRRAVANGDGICVEGRAANNRIGGTERGQRNVVSGNVAYGIDLFGWGVRGNRILGNYVGTDHTGRRAVANTYGVLFDDRAHENVLGGLAEGAGNVISGNTAFGAYFYNNGTRRNVCIGNKIGTDVTGTRAVGNEAGVHIDGATRDNVVDRNLVSGNRVAGITLFAAGTRGNVITRNRIGIGADGGPLGNGADGIRIAFGPAGNTVGGRGAENIIAHNGGEPISVESPGEGGNRILANDLREAGRR